MKIGVLGGTFDPIHNGHIIIAEFARKSIDLDKVIFIPSGMHPFKNNKEITDPKIRYKMIDLAIQSNPYFQVSNIEIEKTGINYTIDTIRELKSMYKEAEIYFIIGSDILFEIEQWKEFEELIRLCKFILFTRKDKDKKKISKMIHKLETEYNMDIEQVNAPISPISSTEVRKKVGQGKSIKYLVKDNVEKYILENNIYGEEINE